MRSLRLAMFLLLAMLGIGAFSGTAFSQVKKQARVVKKPAKPVMVPVKKMMEPGTRVLVTTDSGTMMFRLYDSTPLHRDNFIAKAKEGFFDSLLFHRVIRGFMIQGGDPQSKNAQPGQMLGGGSAPGEEIPAEFNTSYIHKKGALAAARTNNPAKASSNCQFYIVQGAIPQDYQMSQPYTPEQRAIYKAIGGTPFLDQNYTVFGEVESGIGVIDKLASVPTDPGNRPLTDSRMTIKVLTDDEVSAIFKAEAKTKIKKPIPKRVPAKIIKRKS